LTAARGRSRRALKHFKIEQRGKRRLHKSPALAEIRTCAVCLERELELVRPRVVVALGASAARALLHRRVVLRDERGELRPFAGRQLLITVHPSYLLRLPDAEARARERARFVADLERAQAVVAGLG
jgi:uracil-DNA glycosylase